MGYGPPGGVLLLAVPQARSSLCFTHHWSQSSEPHIGQSHLTSSHPAAVFTLPFRYGSEVTDSIPAAIKGGGVRVSPEPSRLCCKQSKLPAPISY